VLRAIASTRARRLVLWSVGIVVAAALTATATDGATKLVVAVERLFAGADPPVSLTVETNPWLVSGFSDATMIGTVPHGVRVTSSPSGCEDLEPWLRRVGGLDAGSTRLRVVVQGQSSTPVLLSNLRVNVLNASPPPTGTSLYCGPQGIAEISPIFIDLDRRPVSVRSGSGARPFGFTVGQGEIETFDIEASTDRSHVTWTMTLELIVDGHKSEMQIDDHGHPFQTTVAPARRSVWSWDYQGGWSNATGQSIAAGQALPASPP
jgi:hypothetical protein